MTSDTRIRNLPLVWQIRLYKKLQVQTELRINKAVGTTRSSKRVQCTEKLSELS